MLPVYLGPNHVLMYLNMSNFIKDVLGGRGFHIFRPNAFKLLSR